MTDPRRMIDEVTTSAFELELLRSTRRDARRAREVRTALVAAGGISLAGGAAYSGTTAIAKAPAWLAGWIASGLLAAALVAQLAAGEPPARAASGVAGVGQRASLLSVHEDLGADGAARAESASRRLADAAPVLAGPVGSDGARVAPAQAGAPEVRSLPSSEADIYDRSTPERAGVRGRESAPASASAPPVVEEASSLAEEVALLDAAGRALAMGRAAQALSLLDGYARAFPAGLLRPEAALLRSQALADQGARAAAAAIARELVESDPTNPVVKRARSLSGNPESKAPKSR
jgi:hypothetical protein